MKHFRTCPWWLAPTFDNPLRQFVHNPDEILRGLILPGQTVIDLGCGMGYFSVAMAKMVAPDGKVIAVDLQRQMLAKARQRAERAGLLPWVIFHQCTPDQIDVSANVDFALAFWMVHEVRNKQAFLRQVFDLFKPQGKFLIVEPKLHVSKSAFEQTIQAAQAIGWEYSAVRRVHLSQAALFVKRAEDTFR